MQRQHQMYDLHAISMLSCSQSYTLGQCKHDIGHEAFCIIAYGNLFYFISKQKSLSPPCIKGMFGWLEGSYVHSHSYSNMDGNIPSKLDLDSFKITKIYFDP